MGWLGHERLVIWRSQELINPLLGQLGLGRLFIKIDAEATLEPKANIRHLTFHYRQILIWPFGFVGPCECRNLDGTDAYKNLAGPAGPWRAF